MPLRTFALLLAALVALFLLVAVALRQSRQLAAGLPPRTICVDAMDAATQARAFVAKQGGAVIPVLGTGSMAPFIPAAAAGAEPRTTIVGYAVAYPAAGFGEVHAGALVVYRPDWAPTACVIHQAAARDADGWIMTGLHNAGYENRTRVTTRNFVAVTAHVFTWPQ